MISNSPQLSLFLSVYLITFLAEIPDKTAVATMLMASKGDPVSVFVGVGLAFVVQSLVAVVFGSALSLLPSSVVHLGAGVLFLVFAILMWVKKEEHPLEESGKSKRRRTSHLTLKSVWTSFMVIFIAEWGDLTQLSTAALVARYKSPYIIFFAATLALWTVTGIAVWLGGHLKTKMNPHLVQRCSSLVFGVAGIIFIFQFFKQTY